jgi:hypothetical protein
VAKPPRVLTCPNVTHDLILTVLGVAGRFKLPGWGIKKHRTVHTRSTCETRVSTFPNSAAPLYKPPADLRAGAVQFSSALPPKKNRKFSNFLHRLPSGNVRIPGRFIPRFTPPSPLLSSLTNQKKKNSPKL